MFSACSPSRGPTHCVFGTCFCNKGYCRYPHSTLHIQARYCVARVPGKTCHLTRFCWSGGLEESFCESGLCMCKWGYRAVLKNGAWECEMPYEELSAVETGDLSPEEAESRAEAKNHSDRMVFFNVVVAALWASAIAGGLVTTGIVIARRRRSNDAVGYEALLA